MKGAQHLLLRLFLLLAACSMLTMISCSDSPEGPDYDPLLGQELSLSAELKSAGVHLVWNRLDRAICSKYLVQRSSTPNNNYETIDTIDAFIFACVDKQLTANVTYYYRLVALDNTDQQAVFSNVDTVQITGSCLGLSDTLCLIGSGGGESQLICVINSANPAAFEWAATETCDWLSLSTSAGASGAGFQAVASANTTGENRVGLVVITAEGIANSPDTVAIAQATSGQILCPAINDVDIPPLGGINTELTISSCAGIPPVEWVAECDADWLTIQPASATSPTGLLLTAAVNYTEALRNCIVTVRPEGFEEPPDTIIVTQRAPFNGPVDYPVVGTPSSVCGADFNGDGYTDIAVANNDEAFVSILLSNGDGTFAAASDQATPTATKWIRAADLDGDGYKDLATISVDETTISVLTNSGTGTFTATELPPLADLSRLILADCNGDGSIDIVTANRATARLLILANNGSGVFAAPIQLAVGKGPEAVCAANINGVGNLDLLTANGVGNNLSLLINSSGLVYTNAVNFLVQEGPISLCAGDFNGDNRIDVAVACQGTNRVCVLKNTGRTGTSRFASLVNLDVVSGPNSICSSNLDADGDIDMVVAGSGTSVLVNTGLGVFATPLNLGSTGENIADVAAEDVDADGDKDVVVVNQSTGVMTVYINNTF